MFVAAVATAANHALHEPRGHPTRRRVGPSGRRGRISLPTLHSHGAASGDASREHREEIVMTRDTIASGAARRSWIRDCTVAAALAFGLVAAAVHAGDADARAAKPWTRTLQLRLSPQQLGLPASTSARRLARAALRHSARRLGLPR